MPSTLPLHCDIRTVRLPPGSFHPGIFGTPFRFIGMRLLPSPPFFFFFLSEYTYTVYICNRDQREKREREEMLARRRLSLHLDRLLVSRAKPEEEKEKREKMLHLLFSLLSFLHCQPKKKEEDGKQSQHSMTTIVGSEFFLSNSSRQTIRKLPWPQVRNEKKTHLCQIARRIA